MTANRALEFLTAALGSFPLFYDRRTWKAKHFVELALDEVQELLDRLAALEAAQTMPTADGRGVLIVNAATATPARLTARQTAALPGNGKGL